MALHARQPMARNSGVDVAWKPTGSLSKRITRLVMLASIVVSLVAVLPPLWGAASSRHATMLEQADGAIVANHQLATAALDLGSQTGADIAVKRIAESAHADSVQLTDNAGKVIASFVRQPAEASRDAGILAGWQRTALEYLPEPSAPDLRVTRRLDINGDPVGAIEVLISTRPLVRSLIQQLSLALLGLLLACSAALLIAARLRRQIAEPIQHLLEIMDRVAYTQDYRVRAAPHGPDEVGSLIISFNQMLEQIHTRNLRLDASSQKLRELVIERTKNFEAAALEAEKASRAKGDFLARMSHEIRTPMNGVVGMADLLENTRLEEEQHRMLNTMRSSADSLLEIINGILDFSRIEAGQLQVLETQFSVVEVLEEVCELLASRAHERNLELVCDIEPAVPTCCSGDPLRLRQIITNLLGNAVKYTEKGQIILRAKARPAADGRTELRIEVEDTGLGIPEHQLQTVFDAFTQGDSFETRKQGGTGLGLAITKQLVTLLGGEIGLTSTVGVGTTAWVSLPLAVSGDAGQAPLLGEAGVKCVLLVQDNEQALKAMSSLFAAAGTRVWSARTGHRALEQTSVDNFDLAVIDELLPDMAGVELIGRLRSAAETAKLPTVLMTSTKPVAVAATRAHASSSQPDAKFTKPFRRERLLEAVESALGRGDNKGKEALGTARQKLNLRVLLVEDSPVNLEVAVRMLQAIGCSVETASDGALGVEQALAWGFDVIFMDCQMPLMDGFEATARIRAAEAAAGRKPTPIIALTANALQGDRERCLDAGMTDFVSKPFNIAKLHGALMAQVRGGALAATGAVATTDGRVGTAKPAEPPRTVMARATSDTESPVLDPAQIAELLALGQPQILVKAAALFHTQAAQNLDDLDAALQRGDLAAVEQAAHALKSSALSMGGRRFAKAAGACETAARQADLDAARAGSRDLRSEFSALYAALEQSVQDTERAA